MDAASAFFAPGNWPAFVLISARLSGLMLLAPFWSMLDIPRSAKGAIVVVLAAMMVPGAPKPRFPDHILEIPLPLMIEFTIGVAIGLAAAVVTHALTLASEIVALQTGLSLGQVLTPDLETGGPAVAQIYTLLGLAVFVAMGGPAMLIEAVGRSVTEYPPGSPFTFGNGPVVALQVTSAVFSYAIQLAAPVMVAVTVTNLAMAILSRAVPQLNAMAMSFGITLGVGLLILGASLPVLVRVLSRWIEATPLLTDGLLEAMLKNGAR